MEETPRRIGPIRTRGPYRQYLRDATVPIPRSTLWHLRKEGRFIEHAHSTSTSLPHDGRCLSSDLSGSSLSLELSQHDRHSPSLSVSDKSSPSTEHPLSSSLAGTPSPLSLGGDRPPSLSSLGDTPSPLLLGGDGPPSLSSLDGTPSPLSLGGDGLPSLSSFGDTPSPLSVGDDHPSPSSFGDAPSPSSLGGGLPSIEQVFEDKELFEPLYDGADITICGAYCCIMQFASSNKLSYTAISELIKLLHILCPAPNKLPSSFYMLKKFFKQFNVAYEHQRICTTCSTPVEAGDSDCPTCTENGVYNPEAVGDLLHIPIQKALKTVISNHWEVLQQNPGALSSNETLSDVWSGAYLRRLSGEGRYFSNCDNLALAISTDGVPLFKSSNISLWPVYLTILNLPPAIRMNAENVLMAGLWYGKKPPMKQLLSPVMKSLSQFSTLGISISTSHGLVTYRTKLVMGVFDLIAKRDVLCTKQFNGKYGCSVCLNPGTLISRNTRAYLPGDFELRTHCSVVTAAKEAERTGEAVQGVISTSSMASIVNLVDSVPVDYMHAVLEGVTRTLLKAWFLSCNHGEPYYLGSKLAAIDKLLLKQRPPCELSRPPRSIAKHLKYWKASELRNWLLYYSLPLLVANLPPLYLHHYALLVCAIHILLQSEITTAQIDAADEMLRDFHGLLPELYGDARCTHNAHLLTHLAKYVRLWGPLWTHSAFGFENMNGRLKCLFHSRSRIFHQLMFNVDVRQTLQAVHHTLAEVESEPTLNFLQSSARRNMIQIAAHTYILGQSKLVEATEEQKRLLDFDGPIEVFSRLYMQGSTYTSKSYARGMSGKRNNTVCMFKTDESDCNYGEIETFVNMSPPKVIIRVLHVQGQTVLQQAGHPCRSALDMYKEVDLLKLFVARVMRNGPLTAIPLENIRSKAVFVCVNGVFYAIKPPNSYEHH